MRFKVAHSPILFFTLVVVAMGFAEEKAAAKQPTGVSVRYEELNAIQFVEAVRKAEGVCLLPFGVLEKHGPHMPLGTDLINVREIALRAAKQEYTVVFPEYYFGQIFEAKHQPGTIAYSHATIWNLLQETCDELSRNGFKKIIIVNGHGGNNNFLKYFCQVQLEKKRDYAVYLFLPAADEQLDEKLKELRKTEFDGHAGEVETSVMMAHRPELAKPEKAAEQKGEDLARLKDLKHTFTGIWWYARFPHHYAGEGTPAKPEIGKLVMESKVTRLVEMIQAVKQDQTVLELQHEFFERSEKPLETEQ